MIGEDIFLLEDRDLGRGLGEAKTCQIEVEMPI
jgi:hypothetical protein